MDQLVLAFHGDSAHVTEHFVIVLVIYLDADLYGAVGQIDVIQKGFLDIGAFQLYRFPGDVPDVEHALHAGFDLGKDLGFQLVVSRQHFHPFWHEKLDLGNRKLIQDFFQNLGYVLFFQLFTVYRYYRYQIFLLKLLCKLSGFLLVGELGIYHYEERFSLFFQFCYCLFLCLNEIFPWNFPEAAI